MSIKLLNSKTSQTICSNQVIITVSDAIKELLENSLDAESTKIDIKLTNSGLDLIEVSDNGCGIIGEYIDRITKRHATSKLETFEDLEKIQTFGYRGEALHSLCCVGDVELLTKTAVCDLGTFYKFDSSGKVIEKRSVARETGTSVRVLSLFCRLPVRRKHALAQSRQEQGKALSLVAGYCLGSVEAAISCFSGGKLVLSGGGSARNSQVNLESVLGPGFSRDLVTVDLQEDALLEDEVAAEFGLRAASRAPLRVHGWIQRPDTAFSSASTARIQYVLVNARPSEVPLVHKAVMTLHKAMFPHARSPGYVLFLTIRPDRVDANLVPDKRQVMFRDQPAISASVATAISLAFRSVGLSSSSRHCISISEPSSPRSPAANKRAAAASPLSKAASLLSMTPPPQKQQCRRSRILRQTPVLGRVRALVSWSRMLLEDSPPDVQSQQQSRGGGGIHQDAAVLETMFHKSQFRELRVVGQFNKGFILAMLDCRGQNEDEGRRPRHLFIVDQHAADERQRLETLQTTLTMQSQPLLRPVRLQLTHEDWCTLKASRGVAEWLGYRFLDDEDGEDRSGCDMVVSAVPCRRQESLVLDVDRDLVGWLELLAAGHGQDDWVRRRMLPARLDAALASKACRGAVMVGTSLTSGQMSKILCGLSEMMHPWICAHGRPTMRHLCVLTANRITAM